MEKIITKEDDPRIPVDYMTESEYDAWLDTLEEYQRILEDEIYGRL